MTNLLLYVVASILMSVAGVVVTIVVKIAFGRIVPTGSIPLFLSLFTFLASLSLANFLMRSARFSLSTRIQNRLDVIAANGVFARVLNLPVSFFSDYSAGGLSQRITAFADVPKIITDTLFIIMNMVVAVVMALPILFVAPELLPAGLGAIALVIVVQVVTTVQERRLAMRQFEAAEKNGSMVFDLFSGAQRLKLSGSEDRAYARWLRGYAEQAAATYSTRFPLCARAQLVASCRLMGLLAAFFLAYRGHVSVASFAAFSTAYGAAMGCLDVIAPRFKWVSQLGPRLKMVEPILQAVPECSIDKAPVSKLEGKIELDHVTFRYGRGWERTLGRCQVPFV